MEVMYPRCAGLDVHKETVVACVRIVEGGEVSRLVRTFARSTPGPTHSRVQNTMTTIDLRASDLPA